MSDHWAAELSRKKCLIFPKLYGIMKKRWGISAVGSAPHWQCGGHGFKSRMLHLESLVFTRLFCVIKIQS